MSTTTYIVSKDDLRAFAAALRQFKIRFYPFLKISKDIYKVTVNVSNAIILLELMFPEIHKWNINF